MKSLKESILTYQTLVSSISGVVIDQERFVCILFPEMIPRQVALDFGSNVGIQIITKKGEKLPIRNLLFVQKEREDRKGTSEIAFPAFAYPRSAKEFRTIEIGDQIIFYFRRHALSNPLTIREHYEKKLADA